MELVEIASEIKLILRPDTFEAGDELSATSVSLCMI